MSYSAFCKRVRGIEVFIHALEYSSETYSIKLHRTHVVSIKSVYSFSLVGAITRNAFLARTHRLAQSRNFLKRFYAVKALEFCVFMLSYAIRQLSSGTILKTRRPNTGAT